MNYLSLSRHTFCIIIYALAKLRESNRLRSQKYRVVTESLNSLKKKYLNRFVVVIKYALFDIFSLKLQIEICMHNFIERMWSFTVTCLKFCF